MENTEMGEDEKKYNLKEKYRYQSRNILMSDSQIRFKRKEEEYGLKDIRVIDKELDLGMNFTYMNYIEEELLPMKSRLFKKCAKVKEEKKGRGGNKRHKPQKSQKSHIMPKVNLICTPTNTPPPINEILIICLAQNNKSSLLGNILGEYIYNLNSHMEDFLNEGFLPGVEFSMYIPGMLVDAQDSLNSFSKGETYIQAFRALEEGGVEFGNINFHTQWMHTDPNLVFETHIHILLVNYYTAHYSLAEFAHYLKSDKVIENENSGGNIYIYIYN